MEVNEFKILLIGVKFYHKYKVKCGTYCDSKKW